MVLNKLIIKIKIFFNKLIFKLYFYIKINNFKKVNNNELFNNIIFIGDSIIEKYPLNKLFGKDIINRGIYGDTLYNIFNNIYDRLIVLKPDKIFILIGTNDLNYNKKIDNLIKKYLKLINYLKQKLPNSKIYIQSILPVNKVVNKIQVGNRNNDLIKELNIKIKELCKENNIVFINIFSTLLDNNNNLDEIYTTDGLHINLLGYQKITKILNKYIDVN